VYLTGATLFLSLILARVFYIILDFIHVQENFTALQAKTAKQSGATGESAELRKKIRELETQLSASQGADRDFGVYLVAGSDAELTISYPEEAGFAAKRRIQPPC
jgi:hypothetical protein